MGSETGQRKGVGADVALQVGAADATHVTEEGEIEAYYLAQESGVLQESGDRVAGRLGVSWGPLVPIGQIDGSVVLHGRRLSHRTSVGGAGPIGATPVSRATRRLPRSS